MDLVKQFKDLWQPLGANQKISLVLAAGLVALAMIALLVWASRPEKELLYGGLNTDEAGQIVSELERMGVGYELGGTGGSIYINDGDAARIRVKLANQGIQPTGSGAGFEIFDKDKLGESLFRGKINLRRAIQGELARTISNFDGVLSARVMVVEPESRSILRADVQNRATASVFIDTSGPIPNKTVDAIRHMVAYAVKDLALSDVVVVDAKGAVLTEEFDNEGLGGGLASSVIRYREKMEAYFTNRVQKSLDRVLGRGKSEVLVAVDIDTKSVETIETLFDPDSAIERSIVTEESSITEWEASGGVAGTGADVNVQRDQQTRDGLTSDRNDATETQTRNFEINETTRSVVQNPGAISRVTAAIFVAKNVDEQGNAIDRSPEQINQLRQHVLTALAIRLEPGQQADELVTITEQEFAPDPFVGHQDILKNEDQMHKWIDLAKNLIGAALGLGVIIFFWQMMKRSKPDQISIEVLQPEQMLQSRKMEDTSVVTPEMLNELIRQKPANIGVTLKEWIGDTAEQTTR